MKEIWERIEIWLEENYPKGLKMLNKGASDKLILKTEQSLGIEFPQDFKDFYKIHNGVDSEFGFLDGRELLSLKRIQDEWSVWKELSDDGTFDESESDPEEEICDDWWSDRWIPITYDGSGNHDCMDFNPTEKGKIGQIIGMWHDDVERYVVANGFREWLENYVKSLESGQFVYSEDDAGIVKIDDI